MSSSDALATVTATLQHLLSNATTANTVSTQPPSIARLNNSGSQINIFLYNTYTNTTFSNGPIPHTSKNNQAGHPPLALVLKYLITSYGSSDDDIDGQQLMGQTMSLLHNHPLLGRSNIEGISPNSNLHEQVERIRITPDNLSLDDMSKLWSSFQSAEYRLSTGYEISVVLINNTRPQKTPLPVLRRGDDDQGPKVMIGSLATLTGLKFINQKPSAELGDIITLVGKNLSHINSVLRLEHPQLTDPIDIELQANTESTTINAQLTQLVDDPVLGFNWPAGFYTASIVTQTVNTPALSSNVIAMPLAPQIESISPNNAPAGDVVFTIECLPQIRDEQKVSVLFGSEQITPDSVITPPDATAVTTLTFTAENISARAAPYTLRLRVDGIDSLPIDFSGTTPRFDPNQQVTII